MKILYLALIFLLISSCSHFLEEDYKDVNYYTPKFLPSEDKIVVLKNIHKYTETSSPSGKKKDTKSSKWYIIKYDLLNEAFSEIQIPNFDIAPFWIKNGITSVSNKHIIIVSYDHVLLINMDTYETTELSNEIDILCAHLEADENNIILLKGFYTYSLSKYNINTHELTDLIVLDDYYDGLCGCKIVDSNNLLMWYSLQQKVALFYPDMGTLKTFSKSVFYASLYDSNKFALLEQNGNLTFYKTNNDSLTKENFIALEDNCTRNFSIDKTCNYIVYQGFENIYLYDIGLGREEILFKNKHTED